MMRLDETFYREYAILLKKFYRCSLEGFLCPHIIRLLAMLLLSFANVVEGRSHQMKHIVPVAATIIMFLRNQIMLPHKRHRVWRGILFLPRGLLGGINLLVGINLEGNSGDHLLLNLRRIAPFLQLLFHSRVLMRPVNLLMMVVLVQQRVGRSALISFIMHRHLSNRLGLNPQRVVYSQEL